MRVGAVVLLVAGCGRIGFDLPGAEPDAAEPDAAVFVPSPLVAYGAQTCAVFDERLYCWGENRYGQLGDGTTTPRAVPTPVAVPDGEIVDVGLGAYHACAIVDTALYCWGRSFAPTPARIDLPSPPTSVDAGNQFTCVTADVTRCWGSNSVGQLGDGTSEDRATPTPVVGPVMTAIDLGDDHACGLPEGGGPPRCWGHNDEGTLGFGAFMPGKLEIPTEVTGGITTLPKNAGWHACALEMGEVWCWGRGDNGELGDGALMSSPTPVRVPSLSAVTAVETGGGADELDASCAITGGEVWCWGFGLHGRLGNGLTDPQPTPVGVMGLPDRAVAVAVGEGHTCAWLVDGEIWCWGAGDRGQLGHGERTGSFTPVRVVRP